MNPFEGFVKRFVDSCYVRQILRQFTTPILAVLLVIALIVGAVGGYLAGSPLRSSNLFSSYTDNYGGVIDDSRNGFVTSAPLVAGFTRNQTSAPFTGQSPGTGS